MRCTSIRFHSDHSSCAYHGQYAHQECTYNEHCYALLHADLSNLDGDSSILVLPQGRLDLASGKLGNELATFFIKNLDDAHYFVLWPEELWNPLLQFFYRALDQ